MLPIGISFHIFQSFAYVMDVLDGRIAPCRSFLRYALYVSWFPQLVAGPIERPAHLIPQLAAVGEGKAGFSARLPHAAALFAEGWIRKLAAGWTFLLWGAMHAGLMVLESFSRGFWRRAPAVLARPLVWVGVFLAWVPFRAADLSSVIECYRALGHGGWTAPSLGLLFGGAALVLIDLLRVPLAQRAPDPPAGWRSWVWVVRGRSGPRPASVWPP